MAGNGEKNTEAAVVIEQQTEKQPAPQKIVILSDRIFFTKGVGIHEEQLASYEEALRDAGIAPFNLVNVSSIFPAGCKKISREDGLKILIPGQVLFVVMAKNQTNEPSRQIAASIGIARPVDTTQYGYLSEHHPFGETDEKAGGYAEDLAAKMLASILGIKLDPKKQWDDKEQEQFYTGPNGRLLRATNVTQSKEGHKDGLWTTVIAAAVLIT